MKVATIMGSGNVTLHPADAINRFAILILSPRSYVPLRYTSFA